MIQVFDLIRRMVQKEFVLILGVLSIFPGTSISAQLDQATRNRLLNAVVENLNKQAPQMVDSNTMFMNATGYKNVLTYNYKITSVRKDQVDISKLKRSEFKSKKNKACSSPKTQSIFSNGFSLEYQYFDSNDSFLLSFVISPKDCGYQK